MIWHLVAAAFAGLGAAGIGLLLRFASGKRLPRWIIPVFGGLGMLGYQIHYEYTWIEHKQSLLPPTSQVVETEQGQAYWRPWTFFFPMTIAFTVVDEASMAVYQSDEHQLVEFILYRFEKDYVDRLSHQAYLLNCTSAEMAPLAGEPRQPRVSQLRTIDRQSRLYQAVCHA